MLRVAHPARVLTLLMRIHCIVCGDTDVWISYLGYRVESIRQLLFVVTHTSGEVVDMFLHVVVCAGLLQRHPAGNRIAGVWSCVWRSAWRSPVLQRVHGTYQRRLHCDVRLLRLLPVREQRVLQLLEHHCSHHDLHLRVQQQAPDVHRFECVCGIP
jgi:hypothetical protein